ncbi:MAG: hypothetical protein IPK12_23990 [Gemmatimonadetes bacterium]|nr:hypothetical protein [Gemmatimonadota bacterium]
MFQVPYRARMVANHNCFRLRGALPKGVARVHGRRRARSAKPAASWFADDEIGGARFNWQGWFPRAWQDLAPGAAGSWECRWHATRSIPAAW